MARTDFDIPALGTKFIDLRDTISGDAYDWSWVRPLSAVNYIAVHHTGGLNTQTPEEIAQYHINVNGWGGIGYHFLVDKEGAVYYAGDLHTARANVADLNEQVVGVCLIGNFSGGVEPALKQLESTRLLCDFLIHYSPLEKVNTWDCVKGHCELPGQTTSCPGDNWLVWKQKIFYGNSLNRGGIVFNTPMLQGELAGLQETIDYQKKQIENLQLSLATVNGQLISCRESLQEAEGKNYKPESPKSEKKDNTLTLIDALINLYKFILPGKTD